MAKKKPENQETISEKPAKKMLRLLIGIDYKSDQNEQRVEAGLIEEGVLPPAFEQTLRDRKLLFDN